MGRDWYVVKLFAAVFGVGWALTLVPLFMWGAWTPFVGAGIAFVLALVVSVSMVVLGS